MFELMDFLFLEYSNSLKFQLHIILFMKNLISQRMPIVLSNQRENIFWTKLFLMFVKCEIYRL